MADEDWIKDAKAKLAAARPDTRRAGTVAARVEALQPEIAAARAAGKTWEQIAADLTAGAPLNTDAVRIAYVRAAKKPGRAPSYVATEPSAAAESGPQMPSVPKRAKTAATPDFFDAFAPMIDARDARGRGGASSEETGE